MGDPVMPAWWPRCEACGRLVDRYAWTADKAVPDTMTLRVECHGEVMTMVVPWLTALSGAVQPHMRAHVKAG